MKEPDLKSLHPLHFSDQHYPRSLRSPSMHGSFYLNLPHISRSPELSRAYQVGDPVRLIDWKAYARNDQLIVREERDEAMANVVVVLDGRKTMMWPDASIEKETKEKHATKFSIATRIALHLVHLHVRQGDRVRFVVIDENTGKHDVLAVDLRSPSHVLSLYEELESRDFDLQCLQSFLSPHELLYSRTHLLFWISDCCSGDIPTEIYDHAQNVILFHTLHALECDPSWFRDKVCYFDPESAQKEYLGETLKRKQQYSNALQSWCQGLKKTLEKHLGTYVLFTDQTSIRSYVASLDTITLRKG